jgi:uncharacterized protein
MNETQNTQTTCIGWLQATPFRNNVTVLIFTFVALALVAKTVLLFKQASHVGQGDNYPQSIVVTGKAEVYAKPDTLQFNININEDGKDVGDATKKASEKVTKALAVLKAAGVEEKNIKTTNWSTVDKYDSVSEGCSVAPAVNGKVMAPTVYTTYAVAPCVQTSSKVVGATVYQTLEVKIQDIEKNATVEKRGQIVADLAAANIKTDGFTFTVFDLDKVKRDAREEAIVKAKEDARVLARNLGVRLGAITGFSEQDNGGYSPYMNARADGAMMSKEMTVVTPQIVAGEQKVTSVVNITYLLK